MDKKVILAVDDMSESLTIIKTILEESYDVRLSKSPKTALELLRNSPVDMILLDIEMPRMSGFSFLKYIHRTFPAYFKKIPVIIVTAHASHSFFEQAIALGVKDYIVKPINDTILLKKVEAIIGSSDTAQPSDVELPVSAEAEKKDIKDLDLAMDDMDALFLDDMDDMDALFPDEVGKEHDHQTAPNLNQTFTDLRHACSIHSPQAAAIAKDLNAQCSNISQMVDFILIQIYELINNYEYEKALDKIIKLEKELCLGS